MQAILSGGMMRRGLLALLALLATLLVGVLGSTAASAHGTWNSSWGGYILNGNAYSNTIYGHDGYKDYIDGWGGNDYLYGLSGNDEMWGDTGNDYLDGYGGNDYMGGESGNDTLWGDTGSDTLIGGPGNDRLGGESEGDTIYASGDGYVDYISCGSGYDRVRADSYDYLYSSYYGAWVAASSNYRHDCEARF